jgi:hypothetical protein
MSIAVLLAILGILYGGKSFYEGIAERKVRRELGMGELSLKREELQANKTGLTELNKQKMAMAQQLMGQATLSKDTDWSRQLQMTREGQMGQRAQEQFAMAVNSQDRDTMMKMQLIQSLMGSARERGPIRPGERIPITRLIGLGD